MNEFEQACKDITIWTGIILLHTLIYGSIVWYTPDLDWNFGGGVRSQPRWFVYLISNIHGIGFDLAILLIGAILYGIYQTTIESMINKYKKSYPKKSKPSKPTKQTSKYERKLMKGL